MENNCAHHAQVCYDKRMNLRVNNLDEALHMKAKVLAARRGISLRELVIQLLRDATKNSK